MFEYFGGVKGIKDSSGNDLGVSSAPIRTHFSYTSREREAETGLYYYRARYYDPSTGRFLQQDPDPGKLSNPNTFLSRYIYTVNNPIMFTDSTGRSLDDFGRFLAFAAGVTIGVLAGGAIFSFVSGVVAAGISSVLGATLAYTIGATLGVVSAASGGALLGAIAGGAIGASSSLLHGDNIQNGFFDGAFYGFAGGAIGGGISAVATAINGNLLLQNYGSGAFEKLLFAHKSEAIGALSAQVLNFQGEVNTFEKNTLNSKWLVKLLYYFMGREPVQGSPPDCKCQ